jgi:hypothetical protein
MTQWDTSSALPRIISNRFLQRRWCSSEGGKLVIIVGGSGQYDAAWLLTCRSANNNDAGGSMHFHLPGRRRGGKREEVAAASSAAPVLCNGGIRGNTCQPQCAVSGGRNNGTTLQMFAQPFIRFTRRMFLDFLVIAFLDQNIQD